MCYRIFVYFIMLFDCISYVASMKTVISKGGFRGVMKAGKR